MPIETGEITVSGVSFLFISDYDTYGRTPADANCRRKKTLKKRVYQFTQRSITTAKLCQQLKLLTGRPGETLTPTAGKLLNIVTLRPGAVARRAYFVQSDNMFM
jgi:hypothetical protein